ncbi:MAG: ABC transporter permease [Kofleriaceae bacterium]
MLRKPHLRLIAGHSIRHGIRGGAGLVSMLLTLVLGLTLASIVISPLEETEKLADRMNLSDAEKARVTDEMTREITQMTRKVIDWAMDPSPEQLDYLTVDHPAAVSAILGLLFLITPLLACLGGFNQTSGDIASRGLRFLLIRTERPNIFLGRFLGTFVFTAVVFAGLYVIVGIYMAVKIPAYSPSDMLLWLAQGYLRMLVFALPYVALCSWISASIDSPFGSLVIALLIAYMFPLLVMMAGNINEHAKYLQYATPWGFKYWLLMPIGPQLFGGIAIMLGFAALTLFAGFRHFSKRDL